MELKNYMAKMGLHQQILVSYRNNTRRIRCRENAKRDNAIYRRPYEFTAGFSIGGYFGISMVELKHTVDLIGDPDEPAGAETTRRAKILLS